MLGGSGEYGDTANRGLEHISGSIGKVLARHFGAPDIRYRQDQRAVAIVRVQTSARRLIETVRWARENLEAA